MTKPIETSKQPVVVRHADPALRKDKEVVLAAVKQDGKAATDVQSLIDMAKGLVCMFSLGRICPPLFRSVKTATEALKSSDAHVRRVAAEELGKIKDLRSIPALVMELKDGDKAVRDAAVKALRKYDDPFAKRVLKAAGH